MVVLTTVEASNALLSSSLPGLVAVFVGGTSGIGEFSLKAFAKHAQKPRAYFIGRSQEAGDSIKAECQALNPQGKFTFIKADTSLIRNVDVVCDQIKSNEQFINILFLSTGTFSRTETEDGFQMVVSLAYYSRARFIQNFLPLLSKAPSLRRVLSVFAGTKEGYIDPNDFGGKHAPIFPPMAARGRLASLVTLGLEAVAKQAPTVSFIHGFPGAVKSKIARDVPRLVGMAMNIMVGLTMTWVKPDEVGERHLFLMTSAMYAPAQGDAVGVMLREMEKTRGIDGRQGSGVYTVQQNCDSADVEVEKLMAGFRKEGMVEKVREHTENEFKRVKGL